MPELPDIVVYIEAIERRTVGQTLVGTRVSNPFLVRTADPPLSAAVGKTVMSLRRIGKRIAIGLDDDLWLVFHLMIAGRLHWREGSATVSAKGTIGAFHFTSGTLTLTEAGSKRRASLHVVQGESALANMDPGGIDVLSVDLQTFTSAIRSGNHTLKRSLTDPRLFSGIGNAYSDEILFDAGLSPVKLTSGLTDVEVSRLYHAIRGTLDDWVCRVRALAGSSFPEKVTAFREGMAVHGRYEQPCIRCQSPIQRIRYADNETNYCVTCQTSGKLLADRALSRLLRKDWPKTLDELEALTKR